MSYKNLFFFLFLSGCSINSPDVFVIPESYVGYVLVIHRDCYPPVDKSGQSRLFRVPAKGIIRTSSPQKRGMNLSNRIYNGKIDEKSRIKVIDNNMFRDDQVNASMMSVGVATDNDGKEVEFSVFYVGTKKQVIKFKSDFVRLNLDSLIICD